MKFYVCMALLIVVNVCGMQDATMLKQDKRMYQNLIDDLLPHVQILSDENKKLALRQIARYEKKIEEINKKLLARTSEVFQDSGNSPKRMKY